jgi:hypothetical protein
MTGGYTFVTPERQNELTRRIRQKLSAAGKNAAPPSPHCRHQRLHPASQKHSLQPQPCSSAASGLLVRTEPVHPAIHLERTASRVIIPRLVSLLDA